MNLDPHTMTRQDFDEAEATAMLMGARYDWRSQSAFILTEFNAKAVDRDVQTGEILDENELIRRHRSILGSGYGLRYQDMLRWRRDIERGIINVPLPHPGRQ